MRAVSLQAGPIRHAEGSCLIRMGGTEVLCTASVEDRPPPFLKGTGMGWVTAEYGMLPRATATRSRREAVAGRQGGRTVEIQRLIGRALRAAVDRRVLGERQIVIDCDVLQADAGTRCAAITGGWVALRMACDRLVAAGTLTESPIVAQVAAVSCGLFGGQAVLDLDYAEDSQAAVDGNFVRTDAGAWVEVQISAEGRSFESAEMSALLTLADGGCRQLFAAQRQALSPA
jgi:ribonuclease PH